MRAGFAARVGLLIVCFSAAPLAAAPQHRAEVTVCDPAADYFLGMEDYPDAIRLHLQVLKRDPRNGLAHYHLGFAYGMVGRIGDEIYEYRQAVGLGLHNFDLFLNFGLAQFEIGDLIGATQAFRTACTLTERPEPHFDLGLVYARRGMFREAESEILLVLASDPHQPDYLNTLAVIAAEEGDIARAREVWLSLLSRNPRYQPARANLRMLESLRRGAPDHASAQDEVRERRSALRFVSAEGLRESPRILWLPIGIRQRPLSELADP